MPNRTLDMMTLQAAAQHYAATFLLPDRKGHGERWISGPSCVMQDFYNFTFRDEFEAMLGLLHDELGAAAQGRFDALAKKHFKPRSDKAFDALLAERLAITRSGEHIEGRIGTVHLGARPVGFGAIEVETAESIRFRKAHGLPKARRLATTLKTVPLYWPIYAGEAEERERPGGGAADPLPAFAAGRPLAALNTVISNEAAIAACDAIVDRLDEGTGAAVIQGRSGAQPADVDTAVTGTLLFTIVCQDPAFGNAADDTGKATATAATPMTDDASADATGTLGYCRASATNDGATPLDDHIDGEAGTSSADFVFNTLSIVSGSTVSMSSWTVSVPEQ